MTDDEKQTDLAARKWAITDYECRAQDAEDRDRLTRASDLRARARALRDETEALYGAGASL